MSLDCSQPQNAVLCKQLNAALEKHDDKLDSMQKQIYILLGVGGAAALFLMAVVIVLAIQLSILRKKLASSNWTGNGNPKLRTSPSQKSKTNYPRSTGNTGAPPHSFAQSPQPTHSSNMLSAEEELAQLGFSAYRGGGTGGVDNNASRGLSPSAISTSTAGGVRVLPRNPPTGFRHNQGYNEDY